MRINLLLIFILMFTAISCKDKEVDCNAAHISNIISVSVVEADYKLPQKGEILFTKKNTGYKEIIHRKSLKKANLREDNSDILLIFEDMPEKLKSDLDYRIILDDTIVFDINNINMVIDTLGRTMGGWSVVCKLESFNANGEIQFPSMNNSFNIPYNNYRINK